MKNKIFICIYSNIFPLKIKIFDECGNEVYCSNTNRCLNIELCLNSSKIQISISNDNQTQYKNFEITNRKTIYWYYSPIEIKSLNNTSQQDFTLLDEFYNLPINAILNFSN